MGHVTEPDIQSRQSGGLTAIRCKLWGSKVANVKSVSAVTSLLAFYGVYGYLFSGAFPRGWAFVVFSAPGILFLVYALFSQHIQQKMAA